MTYTSPRDWLEHHLPELVALAATITLALLITPWCWIAAFLAAAGSAIYDYRARRAVRDRLAATTPKPKATPTKPAGTDHDTEASA